MKTQSRVAADPVPATVTDEEFDRLLAEFNPRSLAGRRDRALVSALYGAGLRVSEAINLEPGDLMSDPHGYLLHAVGKGSRARPIRIGDALAETLLSWRDELNSTDEQMFPVVNGTANVGKKILRCHIYRALSEASSRAGIIKLRSDGKRRGVNPHMLRHSYTTALMSRGFGLHEVQAQLGHKHLSTTARYAHVLNAEMAAKIKIAMDEKQHVDSMVAKSYSGSISSQLNKSLTAGLHPVANEVQAAAIASAVEVVGAKEALYLLTGLGDARAQG